MGGVRVYSTPTRGGVGAGALLYLEDEPTAARAFLHHVFAPALPEVELAWVDTVPLARTAIQTWPRFAAFVLDYRLGKETCAEVLGELRVLYPPPTPVYLLTAYGDDPAVLRLMRRHDALLIEKRRPESMDMLVAAVRRSRDRVLARRELLRATCGRLTPREVQLAELAADGVTIKDAQRGLGIDERYSMRLVRSLLGKTAAPALEVLLASMEREGHEDERGAP